MPTYHYQCRKCSVVHEIFHGINEPPRTKCPDCGGRLDRLVGGGAGVILKGSGFHNTDYRSKGWHESAKKESASPAPKAGSSPSEGAKADAPKKPDAPKKSDGSKGSGGSKAKE